MESYSHSGWWLFRSSRYNSNQIIITVEFNNFEFQGGQVSCMMPSMDVYSRDGDKLSENWIILDLVYWLKDQGLDIFKRTNEIHNPDWI